MAKVSDTSTVMASEKGVTYVLLFSARDAYAGLKEDEYEEGDEDEDVEDEEVTR